jgi:hypothetical protein
MSRDGNYGLGKRQREAERARKKREKAERRQQKRADGPAEIEYVSREELLGDMPSVDEAMRVVEMRTAGELVETGPPCRLFVGSLSWDTNDEGLRAAFGELGNVIDAVIVKDRDTGGSRGFGFVTMETRKDAMRAIQALDGQDLDGRRIVVKIANDRD